MSIKSTPSVRPVQLRKPKQLDLFSRGADSSFRFLLDKARQSGRNIIFLDLETSGRDLDSGHEITEFFLLKYDSSGREVGRLYSSVNPVKRISYGAFRAHGKNNPDLGSYPSINEVLPKIRSFIDDSDILCGYNIAEFDIPFLTTLFAKAGLSVIRNRLIDVYDIVKRIFPDPAGYGLGSRKQEVVAKYLGIDTGTSHQAGDDVMTARNLLLKLLEERPDEVGEYLSRLPFSPPPHGDRQASLAPEFDKWLSIMDLNDGLEKLGMEIEDGYIKYDYIKPRTILTKAEQVFSAARALEGQTLIGMSTGLGKTIVILLMSAYLKKMGAKKIVFLVPQLSIINNHAGDIKRIIRGMKLGILSHETRNHEQIIAECDFLMGTPETIYPLSKEGKIPWADVALLAIDEGHKIKEKYYGPGIVAAYQAQNNSPLITALTATIGEEIEEVKEMLKDFGIPLPHTQSSIILKDKDEVGFPHQTEVEKIGIGSLNTVALQLILKKAIVREMDYLRRNEGFLEKHSDLKKCIDRIELLARVGKLNWKKLEDLLSDYFLNKYKKNARAAKQVAEKIVQKMKAEKRRKLRKVILKWELYVSVLEDYVQTNYQKKMRESRNFDCMKAAGKVGSLKALLSRISSDHLFETHHAVQRLKKKKTQGAKELCRDPEINFLFRILELIFQYRMDKDAQLTQKWEIIQAQSKSSLGSELPSLEELAEDPRLEEILKLANDYRLPEEKVLILADHRDTVGKIADQLQALGLPASYVWGSQSGEQKGMTGKKKIERVEAFRKGDIMILVSTKFLGLGVNLDFDILIIENLTVNPKEWEQMIGRVGRTRDGHVYYFVGDNETERTKEWALKKRLKRMEKTRKSFRR